MTGRLFAAFGALLIAVLCMGSPALHAQQGEVRAAELPREAQQTLALIRRGGPYPFRQDSVTFGNRERILALKQRDYYHEYTVVTPGSRDRGARRIIAGGSPPAEFFYTDDHYRSFRRIRE